MKLYLSEKGKKDFNFLQKTVNIYQKTVNIYQKTVNIYLSKKISYTPITMKMEKIEILFNVSMKYSKADTETK
jgi:hypothetical protein